MLAVPGARAAEKQEVQKQAVQTVMLIDDDTIQFAGERIAVGAIPIWNHRHSGALCAGNDVRLFGGTGNEHAVQRVVRFLNDAGCKRVALVTEELVR
jgi:hypothetical protein